VALLDWTYVTSYNLSTATKSPKVIFDHVDFSMHVIPLMFIRNYSLGDISTFHN